MSAPSLPPVGAPLAASIEGVLDGRVDDAQRLQAAAADLSRAGAGTFRCELRGGRFSLLPLQPHLPAGSFDATAQARFLDALQALVACAVPGSVETNLRCRLLYADEVVETLFVGKGDHLEPLTRRRPRTAADVLPVDAPNPTSWLPRGQRWLLPAVFVLTALMLWRAGLFDRLLSPAAATLATDTGPFGAMLALRVERDALQYTVELVRGPEFPSTPAALQRRLANVTDLEQLAAGRIVGDGRDLFVQLLDGERQVLAEDRVELRALLEPDATVQAHLAGHRRATTVQLALVGRRR